MSDEDEIPELVLDVRHEVISPSNEPLNLKVTWSLDTTERPWPKCTEDLVERWRATCELGTFEIDITFTKRLGDEHWSEADLGYHYEPYYVMEDGTRQGGAICTIGHLPLEHMRGFAFEYSFTPAIRAACEGKWEKVGSILEAET